MKQLSGYFQLSRRYYYLLIDKNGNICSANPLFLEQFAASAEQGHRLHISSVTSPSGAVNFLQVIRHCLSLPGKPQTVELTLCREEGKQITTIWECAAFLPENDIPEFVECIATSADDEQTERDTISPVSLERYMAFEHSAEGLWMFVIDTPVSLSQPIDEVLEYWSEHSYLVECNDNMARMYGFDKAKDLIGAKLGQLQDLHDPERINEFRRFAENQFRTTTVESKEFDKDGNVKYFLNRMTGIVESGKLKRVWGTQQDITAQRIAEEKLRASELFLRNLFVNSLDGILITDKNGDITFVSPSVTPLLGYEGDEITGMNCFSFVHPEDREFTIQAFNTEVENKTSIEFISARVKRKNGEWMWCLIRGHNLIDNPIINGVVVNFYNDTVRKKTENELLLSESRFRYQATILNNVTDVIVTTDLERNVTSWNHMMEKLTGISESEVLGKPFRYVLDTEYAPFTNEQVISIVSSQGVWYGEVTFTGIDGERKYMLTTISLLRDEHSRRFGLMAVGKDITDRKRAEERLQESEVFYRNLITHSLDGILLTDYEGTIRYCSPSIKKISGYETAELFGRKIFDYVHPSDISVALEAFAVEYRNESKVNYLSLRLRHASGEWVWCTVRGHNMSDNPVFNSMIIYFTNDSSRKAIEDKLRDSERRFRSLFNNMQIGVTMREPNGKLIMANRAAEKMLGLSIDEISCSFQNEEYLSIIYEDGSPVPIENHPVAVSLRTGNPVRGAVMGVYRKLYNDRVWLIVNTEPVLNNEGQLNYLICSFMDISEQKKLAQQLIDQEIQKQKQVTQATIDAQEKERIEIGKELHDNINQHLNTTRLYLEVAKDKTGGEVQEMIHLAHKNLAGIINEIRHLSQSLVPPTLGDIGLAESVQDLCDSLRRVHKFSIEFNSRHFYEEDIPDNVRLTLFRIIQEKISNIIRHSGASQINIRLFTDAEHIYLTIVDNGKGFDPKNVKAGLGLSNIRTRTALFNGKMELKSAPGEGCTLSVIIPHHRQSDSD